MENDLISRKDVIAALIDADWIKTTAQQAVIAEVLNKIPSVKPESKLIANITVNKEEMQQLVADAAKDIIKDLGWIPVTEQLPDDRNSKLVCLSSGEITIASYNDHIIPVSNYEPIGWCFDKYVFIDFGKEEVIAWMPLPEPYTEVGNGKDSACN